MADLLDHPPPMMGAAAHFHHDPADRLLGEDQTDAVRIVDPPGDLVAEPVKPERLNLVKRVLLYEGQHGLSKVIPEAPNRSQKVVSMLKCSVIETINGAPF